VPVVRSAVPLASVWMTLTTQVLSPAFTIGVGAAKKQLASSAHAPAVPPQSASVAHTAPVFELPMQCLPGPAPKVQFRSLVPLLADSVAALLEPDIEKM
jgi:hypothetical protein